MTALVRRRGYEINHKHIQRPMQDMDLQAIYPKRRTTWFAKGHKVYPYLLRNLTISRPNQVWSADITYIPMLRGFSYLVAIMECSSRYVVTWQLSNTLDGFFCLEALDLALQQGRPAVYNTDQGAQFTALAFTSCLEARHSHQYGWPWACPGQRVRGAALAHGQVRARLPVRVRIGS